MVDDELPLYLAGVSITDVLEQLIQGKFTPRDQRLLNGCMTSNLDPFPQEQEGGMSSVRAQDLVPHLSKEVEVGVEVDRGFLVCRSRYCHPDESNDGTFGALT